MVINPLFDPDDDSQPAGNKQGYILPNRHGRKLQPLHDNLKSSSIHPAHPAAQVTPVQSSDSHVVKDDANAAVELIRRKLETIYAEEPNTSQELAEVIQSKNPARSPHQQFMYDLSTSGKSLAEIQSAWHEYYANLPDQEKHAVWQEFYAANARPGFVYNSPAASEGVPEKSTPPHPQMVISQIEPTSTEVPVQPTKPLKPLPKIATPLGSYRSSRRRNRLTPSETPQEAELTHVSSERPAKASNAQLATLKKHIQKRVKINAQAQQKVKQHLHSLLFGLGLSSLVTIIILFGLFNQIVITPFIQPSRHAGATPIILSTDDVAPTSNPEVIIPKINVEIPVDYTQTSTDEKIIESALNSGTVHYASTSKPGEKGNVAIFGHSSNNIFNPGKYKFAFVLLHTLVPGDIFYLTYNNKVYSYRVYDKQIVSPSTVSVLDPVAGRVATATLITCDPPGTSLNRLVVWGEQINPDPNANNNATTIPTATTPQQIAGNGPSLWKRITSWF